MTLLDVNKIMEIIQVNLGILGLIFDILGVLIIIFTEIINPFYGRREDVKWWSGKKYWWNAWRPFYKNTQTLKWVTKWNHKPGVEGIIPPKYKLEFFGILLIIIGFILHILLFI